MNRNKDIEINKKVKEACKPFKKVAFFPGRFAPAHKAHFNVIKELTEKFDKVVIGIGSCYEVGTARHPLLAVFREKILLSDLKLMGIEQDKVEIVHLQDFKSDMDWIKHITRIADAKGVTHFVTGNKKDVLGAFEKNNIELPYKLINPEETSHFGYHATDLRNAIEDNDYDKFLEIASYGTVQLMGNICGFQGIRTAIENQGTRFLPGRQTVDVVLLVTHQTKGHNGRKVCKDYLLCGRRDKNKKDFPGYIALPGGGIDEYESPVNAALRELEEETGIKVELLNNSIEPAHVLIKLGDKNIMAEMKFVDLFSSKNKKIAGTRGGSSQVFAIHIYANPKIFQETIRNDSDLKEVGLYSLDEVKKEGMAFDQYRMVKAALRQPR